MRYKDENGNPINGAFTNDLGELTEKTYLLKGRSYNSFVYPSITRKFSSPLINDYNLYFRDTCPGKTYDECITRVLENKKPMGFIHEDNDFVAMVQEPVDHIRALTGRKVYSESGIEVGYSITGTFGEAFDMDALKTDYSNFLIAADQEYLLDRVSEFISSLKGREISSFLTGYDYANPKSPEDFILTGLLLGYPIETTFSIIWNESGNNCHHL